MSASSEASAPPLRYCIGYAFEPKKFQTFNKPTLIDHAKQNGIDLVPIDPHKPLIEQGPFHCIIHKLYEQDWHDKLRRFASESPNTIIVDPPDRIERLHNRISMLEFVNQLKITRQNEKFGVPNQVLVGDSEGLSNSDLGLTFPVIAKPLMANGNANSHELFVVLNSKGLEFLKDKTPIVLQEFVNHSGVIFKVYVAGKEVQCVKRRSLPDISNDHASMSSDGIIPFSRISAIAEEHLEKAELPPSGFVEEIARALQEELGLRLFNFDLIRNNSCDKYLVIDINYFPGYAKIPSYELLLTDFFLDILGSNKQVLEVSSS
ncbi:hypothetical protein UlMin_024849 [Ulmus minor]